MTKNTIIQSIFILIILAVIFTPVYLYLFNGWRRRCREIISNFPEEVVKEYFGTFFSNEIKPDSADPPPDYVKQFQENYFKRFGRHHFLIPGILLAIVTGVFAILAIQTIMSLLTEEKVLIQLPETAIFALAGAYAWVVYEINVRVRKNDLSSLDISWLCFRFIIAIPLGYAFAGIFKDYVGYVVAFMLGGFPTKQLVPLMRRISVSKLGIGEDSNEPGRELEKLQGIGRLESERFAEEGVGTILQLAYADPIDLTIRTGFSFSFTVDCCSQALAWLSFESNLEKLRKFGLRGAQEIRTMVLEMNPEDPQNSVQAREKELAYQSLTAIAEDLGMKVEVLERSFDMIAWDPQNIFLYDVWQPSWN